MHFMELPKGARAQMALDLLVSYRTLADYTVVKSFLAAFIQPRGCAGGRFVDF